MTGCEACRAIRRDDFGKAGSVARDVMNCMVRGLDHAQPIATQCITSVKNVRCIQCRLRKKFDLKNNEELVNIYRHAEG